MSDLEQELNTRLREGAARAADLAIGRATHEGLADVSYVEHDSAIGPLLLARTARGLVRVAFADIERPDDVLEELSTKLSPRVLRLPRQLDRERRELDEYLDGTRRDFDVELDWTLVTSPFQRRVLEHCAAIPYGHVRTYSDMALDSGNPRASRAAGTALGRNPIPLIVPCHRVIGRSGSLTGYGGGIDRKRHLLTLEGALLV